MPSTRILNFPVPRRVTLVLKGRRRSETCIAVDEVPIAVPDLSPEEAPATLRIVWGEDVETLRSHEGRLYRSLGTDEDGFDAQVETLRRMCVPQRPHSESAGQWKSGACDIRETFEGLDHDWVGKTLGDQAVRLVEDDGRPRQAQLARDAADRVALIGGRLYVVAPVPYYRITFFGSHYPAEVGNPDLGENEWETGRPQRDSWGLFAPDRREAAVAVGSAVGIENLPERSGIEILDEAAYLSTSAPEDLDALALSCARDLVNVAVHPIGMMGDEVVEAYMACRAAVESGDPEAARVTATALARGLVDWTLPAEMDYPEDYAAEYALIAARGTLARFAHEGFTSDLEDDLALSEIGL